jgi:heme oxygenase
MRYGLFTDPRNDQGAYLEILSRFYGFYQPVEYELQKSAFLLNAYDYSCRLKEPLLTSDLRYWDITPKKLDKIRLASASIGARTNDWWAGFLLYLENQTLDLYEQLRNYSESEKISDWNGIRFYRAYGSETPEKVRLFRQLVKEKSKTLLSLEKVREGELAANILWRNWFAPYLLHWSRPEEIQGKAEVSPVELLSF